VSGEIFLILLLALGEKSLRRVHFMLYLPPTRRRAPALRIIWARIIWAFCVTRRRTCPYRPFYL